MNPGAGLEVDNRSLGGGGDITVTYYDKDADRMLSGGDQIIVESTLGPLEYGKYEIRLERGPDGPVIASAVAMVP